MRLGSIESLQQLVEIARNPAASAMLLSGLNIGKDDKEKQSQEKKSFDRSMTSKKDHNHLLQLISNTGTTTYNWSHLETLRLSKAL
ncbi:hypothetical protein PVL29_004850 [Vitis rotundifolia]|uniref:Uncharacterized protein n=1 Tax=Vitis rotundifolia TaxID=103349 RepID=A0AA39DYV5_VITRO|nr:hypothetical protein PVL29_004850 [Vitis rotundifolia]